MSRDDIAIRVDNVSKSYQLWKGSKNRLSFLMKRLLGLLWPRFRNANHQLQGYQAFHALKNISFEIKKGESWGFVGVNGSGKSTLLKMISGNLRLSTGRIEVDGKVAILDYSSGLNGEFTGIENIFIKAALLGLTKKQIQERVNSIIEFAEIGDFIHQPVKTYSSGMVSRLGFAIMAHVDADIIITDEALAVGDVFFVQKCMGFIRDFLKRGTFLFVSHSTSDVLSLCQNAIWLEHGSIKAIGRATSVIQDYLDQSHLDHVNNLEQDESQTQQVPREIANIKSEIMIEQTQLSQLMDYKYNRANEISHLPLFNEIEILPCQLAESAGVGGAKITRVSLQKRDGTEISRCVGGETVVLAIEILALQELKSPMIGFQVIDSTGQVLFADNSALLSKNQRVLVNAETTFMAEFSYQMPLMPVGEYSVRLAIAVGEEDGNAILLQTINQGLVFRSVSSCITQGLIGIPMEVVLKPCHQDRVASLN